MQDSRNGAAACHSPAEQHPCAPKQVQEQNGFRENEGRVNGLSPPPCKLPFVDYPPIICTQLISIPATCYDPGVVRCCFPKHSIKEGTMRWYFFVGAFLVSVPHFRQRDMKRLSAAQEIFGAPHHGRVGCPSDPLI